MLEGKLFDEAARLAALRRYNILDTAHEEPFDKITSLVRTVLVAPFAAVSLIDETRMWFKSIQGLEGVTESPREMSFCTHTIRAREPMVVFDAKADPRFCDHPAVQAGMLANYAGVPLSTPDGYNVGALCIFDVKPRYFAPAQIELLKSFGTLVVDELELRQIAHFDHLTGTLTRRAFLAAAEKEIARCLRYDRKSSLAVFDVDHFKSVNDRFGHPAGDQVLQEVARRCLDVMRPTDVLGRVGGEEFALLLSEVDGGDAMHAAERFRLRIESPAMNVGERLTVTASFGIASLTPEIQTPEAWLARADLPLYKAKSEGRNRCHQADASRETTPVDQMP